jgi:hypothetical protein
MKEGSKHTEETKAKISKSMQGSSNNEKWDESFLLDVLPKMIEYLETDLRSEVSKLEEFAAIKNDEGKETGLESVKRVIKTITSRPHLMKKVRLHFKIYHRNWFYDIGNRWREHETITGLLGAIHDLCEVNTYESASKGTTSATMAKMNLSTHYGWADKTETEDKTENKEDYSKLSTDELKRRIEEERAKQFEGITEGDSET